MNIHLQINETRTTNAKYLSDLLTAQEKQDYRNGLLVISTQMGDDLIPVENLQTYIHDNDRFSLTLTKTPQFKPLLEELKQVIKTNAFDPRIRQIRQILYKRVDSIWRKICETDGRQCESWEYDSVYGFDPTRFSEFIQLKSVCKNKSGCVAFYQLEHGFPTSFLWTECYYLNVFDQFQAAQTEAEKHKKQQLKSLWHKLLTNFTPEERDLLIVKEA